MKRYLVQIKYGPWVEPISSAIAGSAQPTRQLSDRADRREVRTPPR